MQRKSNLNIIFHGKANPLFFVPCHCCREYRQCIGKFDWFNKTIDHIIQTAIATMFLVDVFVWQLWKQLVKATWQWQWWQHHGNFYLCLSTLPIPSFKINNNVNMILKIIQWHQLDTGRNPCIDLTVETKVQGEEQQISFQKTLFVLCSLSYWVDDVPNDDEK